MVPLSRPMLSIRLGSTDDHVGEIALADLARIASTTQRAFERLAAELSGRAARAATAPVVAASRLYLIGLSPGSTVLHLAGVETELEALEVEGMPPDLPGATMEGFFAITEAVQLDQPEVALMGELTAAAFEALFGALQPYSPVEVEGRAAERHWSTSVDPVVSRRRVRELRRLPVPGATGSEDVVDGILFAVNLHTGLFSVSDDLDRSTRLRVPDSLRDYAGSLVGHRVRAIWQRHPRSGAEPENVALSVDLAPDLEIGLQGEFFEDHELVFGPPLPNSLREGVIPDLTAAEAEAFLAAIGE